MSVANPAITAALLWLLTALLSLLRGPLLAVALLGESGNSHQQCHCKESDECFHDFISFLNFKVLPATNCLHPADLI
jgi:hypothetical protein